MASCPHCQQNSIGTLAKLWSDAACPIRCPACHGLAYLPTHETTLLNAIVYPGCFAVLAAVVTSDSLLPFYLWAGAWLAALSFVIRKAPLVGISAAQANRNRHYGNIFITLLAIAVALWWLLSHAKPLV